MIPFLDCISSNVMKNPFFEKARGEIIYTWNVCLFTFFFFVFCKEKSIDGKSLSFLLVVKSRDMHEYVGTWRDYSKTLPQHNSTIFQ